MVGNALGANFIVFLRGICVTYHLCTFGSVSFIKRVLVLWHIADFLNQSSLIPLHQLRILLGYLPHITYIIHLRKPRAISQTVALSR